ncbi:hypothetical protein ACRBEF_01655 [Yersinia proxima]|uniref:hypothetical protein n=1 Tax=Yersinia proxima TaxID=2890316 RepID=UPI003D694B68
MTDKNDDFQKSKVQTPKPSHQINDEESVPLRFDSSIPVPKGKVVTESYNDDKSKQNKQK